MTTWPTPEAHPHPTQTEVLSCVSSGGMGAGPEPGDEAIEDEGKEQFLLL